jgi:hypothetical protein
LCNMVPLLETVLVNEILWKWRWQVLALFDQ